MENFFLREGVFNAFFSENFFSRLRREKQKNFGGGAFGAADFFLLKNCGAPSAPPIFFARRHRLISVMERKK